MPFGKQYIWLEPLGLRFGIGRRGIGIAPAHGRADAYQGPEYLVVEVAETGGGPTFSGGSRFVIATKGGALEIGLKAMDERERRMAAASVH